MGAGRHNLNIRIASAVLILGFALLLHEHVWAVTIALSLMTTGLPPLPLAWLAASRPRKFNVLPALTVRGRGASRVVAHSVDRVAEEAVQLTAQIVASTSADDLLRLVVPELGRPLFNEIHLTATLSTLAKLQHTLSGKVRDRPLLDKLINTAKTFCRRGTLSSRGVANSLWAVASLGRSLPQMLRLAPVLGDLVESSALGMNPQEVANTVWAVATLQSDSPELVSVLPSVVERAFAVLPGMNGQNMANTFWASARLHQYHQKMPELMKILLVAFDKKGETGTQHLAMVLWGAGQVSFLKDAASKQVLKRLLGKATPQVRAFRAQQLANLCWGAALCSLVDKNFMVEVAKHVTRIARKMTEKSAELDLPQIVCAFARLKVRTPVMLGRVRERMSGEMLRQMNDWGLCALAWSYNVLDKDLAEFLDFRQSLREEVARRGLSNLLEASQHGPEAWPRTPRAQRAV